MERRIGYDLKRVQSLLRSGMDRFLEERGVTTPQYAALAAIEAEPGISNAALARRSFVTPQTMVRIVANLEAMGLVERQAHPAHGRVLQARLTARGRRLVASCHRGVYAVEAQMLAPLSERERAALSGMLERCARALEDAPDS
jgi:DNA-binding MarR family transcriptional regulator